jgi:hypothetical protein
MSSFTWKFTQARTCLNFAKKSMRVIRQGNETGKQEVELYISKGIILLTPHATTFCSNSQLSDRDQTT